ncbi:MAG: ABC transporter ATP-binding protein [Armatimonadetes bacterium]|nr:ABC transporter ATP-binding protein [Armatimonadota bacterium]
MSRAPGGSSSLLQVDRLSKRYPGRGNAILAVDDVSFALSAGETFGLVGESGCGKSTLARCVLNLIRPTAGRVLFDGRNLFDLPGGEMRALRREMQIIFQDPYSSLDPRMTVRATLLEPLEIHRVGSHATREARVQEVLAQVGLPESALRKYPHEFSGGQRQRLGIARALALAPRLIVADEPVSALDLSIRAQILNLMQDLQEAYGLTYLLIAHDLTIVRHFCHRVAVMFQGQIVESAPTDELFACPLHPYTQALLRAIPPPDPDQPRKRSGPAGRGETDGPGEWPCRFAPRCPLAEEICRREAPALRELRPEHWVRCHLAEAPLIVLQ